MLLSEQQEQLILVDWLDLVGLRYFHVPNSTFTKSWSVKNRNRMMGVKAGVPDLFILVPPHRAKDGKGHLIIDELKRRKGGRIAPEQAKWLGAFAGLESENIHPTVSKGADEAVKFVNQFLIAEPVSVF